MIFTNDKHYRLLRDTDEDHTVVKAEEVEGGFGTPGPADGIEATAVASVPRLDDSTSRLFYSQ